MLTTLWLLGCSLSNTTEYTNSTVEDTREVVTNYGENTPGELFGDFPAEKDLAVLFELFDDPMISAGDVTPVGRTFLPYRWLNTVSQAFEQTDVGDALTTENVYDEWRVVSMRVVPCQPLGIMPVQTSDVLCWPTVRLVWQPVVEDAEVSWGRVDYYADDRAIHAIYPVQPRDANGQIVTSDVRSRMATRLAEGALEDEISDLLMNEFSLLRDSTADYLLNRTHDLREPSLSEGNWSGYGVRPEVYLESSKRDAFQGRVRDFMGEFTLPNDLVELTAFSLPEGRSPAHSDIWVFLQFEGRDGEIHQREITVLSPEDGRELVNIGLDQTVSMAVEDDEVLDALDEVGAELERLLIIDPEDVDQLGDDMADPDAFFVPNTSCASCHRLNDIRFDFHSLSHLEDGNMTISPRVVGDVERELKWVRTR